MPTIAQIEHASYDAPVQGRRVIWKGRRFTRSDLALGMIRSLVLGMSWASAATLSTGCTAPVRPDRSASTRPAPTTQRLKVLAVFDDGFGKLPSVRARIGDRIDGASDALALTFGLYLDLVEIRPWHPKVGEDSEALLQELEKIPPGAFDLIVGFTAMPPPRRPLNSDLSRSRYAGRHMLVRNLAQFFEAEDRAGLQAAEIASIKHGLGQIFGALPACGHAIMGLRPALTARAPRRWSPLNLALIRAHATLDLRQSSASRVPKDIASKAVALLAKASDAERRCASGRLDRRLELLGHVAEAKPEPVPPVDPLQAGLDLLKAGDFKGALSVCGPVATAKPEGRAPWCAGLAADGLGRSVEAIRFLRAYMAHHPNDETVIVQLARQIGRSGDDQGARALLERYVAEHPAHVLARLNLGIAKARAGDLEGAREAWLGVLKYAPGHEDATRLLKQLEAATRGAR